MNANPLANCERIYKNNGQHAEYRFGFTLNGEGARANNRKGGADVSVYQVKSFRATVCHGNDLSAIFEEYADAERFAFVDDEENVWYDMSKDEFVKFAKAFAVLTRDSKKNGGKVKYQLNRQFKQQREWFRQ